MLSKLVSTRGVEVTPELVNEQLEEDFQSVPSLGQRLANSALKALVVQPSAQVQSGHSH